MTLSRCDPVQNVPPGSGFSGQNPRGILHDQGRGVTLSSPPDAKSHKVPEVTLSMLSSVEIAVLAWQCMAAIGRNTTKSQR